MGRPRRWANDAERMAAKRINEQVNEQMADAPSLEANKRTRPVAEAPRASEAAGFVAFRHQPHVPLSLFASQGRGTVRRHMDGKDYVMVSRHAGSDLGELGVVAADDWLARLSQSCIHGNRGWACHTC